MTPNYNNYNYNKNRYLELLKKRSQGDTSKDGELLKYMSSNAQRVEFLICCCENFMEDYENEEFYTLVDY